MTVSRRLAVPGGLVAAAVAGAVATVTVIGGAPAPAAPALPPLSTARVARTDLVTSVLTAGTLGYSATSPVVNQLTGTFTELPHPGRRIAAGGTLFAVDNLPVVLMTGRVPAWRPMLLGMSNGPDVTELERNLIRLGYATGLLRTAGNQFTWATAAAVERWQQAAGLPVTGQVDLGRVLFLPHPVLAGALAVGPGDPAAPGQAPYQASTAIRVVTVPLDPANAPTVTVGERVRIVLPSGTGTPGVISHIGPPAPPPGAAGQAGQTGAAAQAATTDLTVIPVHPARTGTGAGIPVQVSLTTESARGVLAVPVAALLALQGGGYAVEVVPPTGAHHLAAVHTGLFAGSLVQVSGPGITPGTKVVVAQ